MKFAALACTSCRVSGKSNILQMLVIAQSLEIPVFIMYDADGDVTNEQHRSEHEHDNMSLMKAMKIEAEPFPDRILSGETYMVWPLNIGEQIKVELGEKMWIKLTNIARRTFDQGARLNKNPLFVAEVLRHAWEQGCKPASLVQLVKLLVRFASSND